MKLSSVVTMVFLLLFGLVLGSLLQTAVPGAYAYAEDSGGGGGVAAFLAWLNSPTAKMAWLLVGGFMLKQWPLIVNKAIPFLLLVVSTITQVLHAAFPDVAGGTQPAAYVAAAFSSSGGWGGFLFGSVVPVVLAIGVNSKQKNLFEWAQDGFRILNRR